MNLPRAVVDNSPSDVSGISALAMIDEGNALEEQGRIAEAMARYDAAVEAESQCARAHLNRGNILLMRDQFDEARSAYQRAIVGQSGLSHRPIRACIAQLPNSDRHQA
jgi:tetratricopeptide (TPR) repeat protein